MILSFYPSSSLFYERLCPALLSHSSGLTVPLPTASCQPVSVWEDDAARLCCQQFIFMSNATPCPSLEDSFGVHLVIPYFPLYPIYFFHSPRNSVNQEVSKMLLWLLLSSSLFSVPPTKTEGQNESISFLGGLWAIECREH